MIEYNLPADITAFEKQVVIRIKEALEVHHLYTVPNLNLYEFSKYIGVSPKTTSLIINKYLNKNFRSLVLSYRVQKAVYLIENLNGKVKVNEVGELAGFQSRTNFFTAFKEEKGISPRDYMNSIK